MQWTHHADQLFVLSSSMKLGPVGLNKGIARACWSCTLSFKINCSSISQGKKNQKIIGVGSNPRPPPPHSREASSNFMALITTEFYVFDPLKPLESCFSQGAISVEFCSEFSFCKVAPLIGPRCLHCWTTECVRWVKILY